MGEGRQVHATEFFPLDRRYWLASCRCTSVSLSATIAVSTGRQRWPLVELILYDVRDRQLDPECACSGRRIGVIDTAWLVAGAVGVLLGSLLTKAAQAGVVALVEKSLSARFDKEIEAVRSDLRTKESKITALQAAALNGRAGRQALMDKRRIEAVETLWRDVIRLNPFLWPTRMTQLLKLDAIAARVEIEPNIKKFIDTVGGQDLTEKLKELEAEKVRPFLPVDVWNLFSAYQGLLIYCYIRMKGASFGMGKEMFREDDIIDQIKSAVPNFSNYLAEHGIAGAAGLANILRDLVLDSLRLTIKSLGSDMDDIVEIHEIMKKLHEFGQQKSA